MKPHPLSGVEPVGDDTGGEDCRRLFGGAAALIVYADTSALVKLVIAEAGTTETATLHGDLDVLACTQRALDE